MTQHPQHRPAPPWIGALLVVAALILAATGAAAGPPPAEVLAAARRALGLTSGSSLPVVDATARCTGPDGPFTTRVVSAADGRLRFEQHLSSGRTAVLGIAETGAWQYDWVGDSVAVAGPPVAAFLRGHEFAYLALAPETRLRGPEGETGSAVVDNRPVHVLRFASPDGGTVDIRYDAAGGLPAGLVISPPSPAGGAPVVVRYDAWRSVGNLRLPERITLVHGDEAFTYAYGSVTVDAAPGDPFRPSGDFGADPDVAELRRLQREARDAHLRYDPERLVASFHDPLTSVADGRVSGSTPDENRLRFGGYLKSVEFDEWADTEPPRFRVSADGTMAYVIVQKRVRLRTRSTPPQSEAVQFAWMEAWEKREGRWRLMAIASTDRPLDEEEK